MINLQRCIPEIYYSESRDFQLLARAFEVVFNYEKTSVDAMRGLIFDKNFDVRLLTLLAYTMGFSSKHNYNTKDLYNLCSTFAKLLKKKGSLDAIYLSIDALLNAQQIEEKYTVAIDESQDSYNLIITLPYGTKDLELLEDIFDYILPVGFTYTFEFAKFSDSLPKVDLEVEDLRKSTTYSSSHLGGIANEDAERFNFDNPQSSLQQVNTGVVVKPGD